VLYSGVDSPSWSAKLDAALGSKEKTDNSDAVGKALATVSMRVAVATVG